MPKRPSPASVACALGLSAVTTAHASEHRLAIIPQPQEVMIGKGAVSLRGRRVRLVDDQGRTLTSGAASILSRWLQADHGIASVAEPAPAAQTVEVRLSIKPDAAPQPHGYRLVVNDQGIELTGVDEPGLFYAAATFNQLIDHGADHEPRVSHAAIRDWPRFSYRGFMIDSVRKFQPAAWLKSQIEQAAKYKLNVFHWHLTDDQGWRLPVAGWPRLTEIGAWRMRSVNQQIGNKWVEIVRWPGNGHHYGLAEWPATRDEHAQLAQQFDADGIPGQLLQIDTPDEQRFVQQLIARRHDDQVRWWGIDQDDADASAQRFAVYEFPTASTQAARDSAGVDQEPAYGGWYTREEIRDIVAFAASMHVTVVPEIEMPGHCTAALTAYPELACGQPPAFVETRWGIFEHVLCLGEPQTLTFIKDVVSEVADLFPGPWVHVGGDEVEPGRWRACPKCQAMAAKLGLPDEQALKAWWLGQVQRIVAEAGKRMIAWDELLVDGSLPPASAVQWWRAHKRDVIQQALAANHPLIVSPYDPWYLSFPQAQEEMRRKPKWMSINDLRRVYLFEPLPSASPAPDREALILGGEAPLWTERTADEDEMSQRMWPRLLAVSERLWSSRDARDWSDFARRVNQRLPAVEAAGVHVYRPSQPPAVSE